MRESPTRTGASWLCLYTAYYTQIFSLSFALDFPGFSRGLQKLSHMASLSLFFSLLYVKYTSSYTHIRTPLERVREWEREREEESRMHACTRTLRRAVGWHQGRESGVVGTRGVARICSVVWCGARGTAFRSIHLCIQCLCACVCVGAYIRRLWYYGVKRDRARGRTRDERRKSRGCARVWPP